MAKDMRFPHPEAQPCPYHAGQRRHHLRRAARRSLSLVASCCRTCDETTDAAPPCALQSAWRRPSTARGRQQRQADPTCLPSRLTSTPASSLGLRENGPFVEASLHLSRACLGKIIMFSIKSGRESRFPDPRSAAYRGCWRGSSRAAQTAAGRGTIRLFAPRFDPRRARPSARVLRERRGHLRETPFRLNFFLCLS
jgi:hypothetical protein